MSGSGIRPLRILGLVGFGVAALWFVMLGSFEQEIRHALPGGYAMPAFSLPVLNSGLFEGDTTFISSEDLQGKVVLLSFWATWCRPCIAEQPSLLALQEEFEKDGLRVIGVLHRDPPKRALEWLEENDRLQFHTVVGTSEVARAAHVGGLPATLLVDRDGQVTEVFAGYWEERDGYLRERVRELIR